MLKRLWAVIAVIAMLSALVACSPASGGPSSSGDGPSENSVTKLDTVGLYVWDDTPSQHAYWKACGINTLVFCDRGWWYNADSLDAHYQKLAGWIDTAKADGFRVFMLLFSNIEQYKGPEATEPTGLGIKFDPHDEEKLNDRLYYLGKIVEACSKADGFTLLAGDPGGISDAMGEGDTEDFIIMAKAVKALVQEKAPNAQFNINTWAISYYKTPNQSTDVLQFWLNETEMTKEVIAEEGLVDASVGFEFPTHDYYRPLALRPYNKAEIMGQIDEMPLYPMKADIDALKARGVKNVWSWPYFLMDEADDGDPGGGVRTELPQLETRYIYRYLNQMREIGINGVIGNWSWSGHKTKMLNTYAYGRFANDPSATIDQVMMEFAGFVATEETAPTLVKVLKYIENDSNWQKKLPKVSRIANFETDITDPQQALELLATVVANPSPAIPLAQQPAPYLAQLRERLVLMQNS